ncbi:hypothetical protein GGQ86_003990 [Xanthobacter flavus]|uniref:Uncharacterized protein n=1 Tax=Xanthobacter flavus TaxID=281 RepID=A0A9W6CU69_XANFL|nr:hypothetical protein [Xanthobacter flavus]MDR6335495.1 hypothetical protein [Xanthobacter flavus]GLI23948.1 hypothetical protein XFLAVUS301_36220 [Xanthobacter flavus]
MYWPLTDAQCISKGSAHTGGAFFFFIIPVSNLSSRASPGIMLSFAMTPITTHQNSLSSAESRRQLDESIERAMERNRGELEAVRQKSARLRALREATESEPVPAPRPKARRKA